MKTIMWFFVMSLLSLPALANCVKGNCHEGRGTYIYSNKTKYIGEFRRALPEGKGIMYYDNGNKYLGEWRRGKRHGKGRMQYRSGARYTGEFRHDKFNGNGEYIYASGDAYNGEWVNNYAHGQGQYHFKHGERYNGAFVRGKFDGYGRYDYQDGSYYEGEWSGNRRHGQGALYRTDGSMEHGEWQRNRLVRRIDEAVTETNALRDCNRLHCASGQGQYTYGDGSTYSGAFRDGQAEGIGIVRYANGDRYEGGWKDHSPHGEGTMYFASGKTYSALWHLGHPTRKLEAPIVIEKQHQVRPAVEQSDEVKIWAVIIGIATYNHMSSLRYTDDDAYQLYAFLKSPEGGAIPDSQLRVLIDEAATRANILDALTSVFGKADANDVVMLYFSGHGLDGSFIPYDYDGLGNVILHEEIRAILDNSRAKHKICFADACHAGSYLASRSSLEHALADYYRSFEHVGGGTALLLSSKRDEISLEFSGLRQGVFSHYLIRGLKGAADTNADRLVTITELYDYVHRNVRAYTADKQSPILSGAYDKNMPVSLVRL